MTDEPKRLGRPPKPKLLRVRILRGYWPADGGVPLAAGEYAELPIDEAKGLLRVTPPIAERADPLPGGDDE
jgi:hypothetical protein